MVSFRSEKPELNLALDGTVRATFRAPKSALKALSELDGELDVEVKKHREKRSLDANAYMWVLLDKIAENVGTCKDEIYLTMLERYGVFTHVIAKPGMVEQIRQSYPLIRELGEVTVNGTKGTQLQLYIGSSHYDTKQMSRLIDGVVSEAKELGIDTRTPEEIALMKDAWGK